MQLLFPGTVKAGAEKDFLGINHHNDLQKIVAILCIDAMHFTYNATVHAARRLAWPDIGKHAQQRIIWSMGRTPKVREMISPVLAECKEWGEDPARNN